MLASQEPRWGPEDHLLEAARGSPSTHGNTFARRNRGVLHSFERHLGVHSDVQHCVKEEKYQKRSDQDNKPIAFGSVNVVMSTKWQLIEVMGCNEK